jgi:putative sterol carrier protein
MTALELLHKLPAAFNPEAAASANSVIQFNISQPAFVTIRDGICTVTEGSAEAADLALGITDDNLVALMTGKLNGVMAMMSGKLKVSGDMGLAQKIGRLFDPSKLA